MLFAATPPLTTGILLFVSFLLVMSGRTKKKLEPRSPTCRVCHRDRKHCTCHWL
jgi:hypothetical protein